MKKSILNFPKQFKTGIQLAGKIQLDGKFKSALICGMGGSSIPGYMAEIIHPKDQIKIHPDYDLPSDNFDQKAIVVCVSWSGNTEETISSYQAAVKNGFATVVITKGGKLGELAKNNNSQVILLPDENIPPRIGVGYMYGALSAVLSGAGVIQDESPSLLNLEIKIQEKIQLMEERAKELAENIGSKTPLIYSSFPWRNLGGFWKIFFNENSKVHAFWNSFPGMAHQEIAGFNKNDQGKFFPILLEDKDDDSRYNESLGKLDLILEELGYTHDTVEIEGDDKSEKVFKNYILAALTSFYLAEKLGVNPESIELIEKFKKT